MAGASSPSGAAHGAPHTPGPLAAPARLCGGGRGPPGPPVLAGGLLARARSTSLGTHITYMQQETTPHPYWLAAQVHRLTAAFTGKVVTLLDEA